MDSCSEQTVQHMLHFASQFALAARGLLSQRVRHLYGLNYCKDPLDFLLLSKKLERSELLLHPHPSWGVDAIPKLMTCDA